MRAAPSHAIEMTDADALARALDRLDDFCGVPFSVQPLHGGLTNRS